MTAWTCRSARERVHRLLDGDLLDAATRQGLDEHLATCGECRELRAEMASMLEDLRLMPTEPFDDARLEQVWAATTRAARVSPPSARRWTWTPLAAAAVLAVALVSSSRLGLSPAPTSRELQETARKTRLVLALASRGLHATGRATAQEVFGGEISRALRRVPIDWPGSAPDRRRENG